MNLNKTYYLKLEIEQIRDQIESLSPITEETSKKDKLIFLLNRKLNKYCDELLKVNAYIEQIEDTQTRVIARYRFIENKSWAEISEKMYMDRTTCSKKLQRYIDNHQ